MSNLRATSRYNGVKPPVIRSINKQNVYGRSPSTSRITLNTQLSNNTPIRKSPIIQRSSIVRKAGSCQNLAAIDNLSLLNIQSKMPQFQSSNTGQSYMNGINRSSTTNNSFGNHDFSQHNVRSTFYNGYADKSSTKPIGNYTLINKSNSSYSPSHSSDAIRTTLSHSISSNGRSLYTAANSSGTAVNSVSLIKYPNDENVYNYQSPDNGIINRQSLNSTPSSTKSDRTKSLNNNVDNHQGLIGLVNLGNTCFMNSVLQCLSNCKPLHEYCLSNKYDSDLNLNSKTRGALIKSYADMMKLIWRTDSENYISPDKFRRNFQRIAPSFNSSAQQDSQEFLRIMLEGLHQDVNKVQQRPKALKIDEAEDDKLPENELAKLYWSRYIRSDNSCIVDLFVGQLKSTLLCRKCGYKSVTFDPFWDLSLPLPKNQRGNTTLADCLDLFTSEEELDGDEMPKCAKCKQKRQCSKSLSIQKFPHILVIHLKRFSGDRYKSKISTFIEFPSSTLELGRYGATTSSQKNVSYSLFGISNHSGTVYGGHYTAFCCHPYSHLWYEFNDTRVRRIDESRVCSSEAYVLFYETIR